MKANRRQILMAGAVAAAATVAATETSFAADVYGSGSLGAWSKLTKAISSATTITSVRDRNGVFMFGDSIGVQDGKALAARLQARDGSTLAVHNWSGRPTAPAVDALQSWATQYGLPKRILMATGTNDIFNPPAMAAQIDRVMRIAGSQRTVVWVNTQISRSTVSAAVQVADQRNSAWVNSQLSEAQKQYSNLRIVRWAEFLASKPSRLNTYLREGVHTTIPQGQDSRNELIVQALTAR